LIEQGIGLCVFDNLSSLTPGLDENSKRDWDLINQYLLDLRRHGITSIIIHHTTKNKKEQRGTSGRTDNIDVWCNIERDERSRNLKLTFRKWRYEPSDLLNDNTFSMDGYNWAPVVDRQDEMSKDLKQILELIGQGISQTEISKRMDVSQPYISKIKKQFVQEGLIDGDSKLTEKGTRLLRAL
jgi:putative DNA primase/helicase